MKKTMDFFVHTKDVDHNDIIRPSAILDLFQDLAGLHAEELGVGYQDLRKLNYAWVVLYQQFEMKKLPPYLDKVYLTTWPKPKGRLEYEREYLLKDSKGEVLGQGISNWIVIDLSTRSLVRSDKVNFNGEFETFTNYPEKCKRKLNLKVEDIIDEVDCEVTLEDIDHNGHMNNARYLSLIQNNFYGFDSKKYVRTAEISYIKEAKYKDIIKIKHFAYNGCQAYVGYIEDELCFECLLGEEEI